MDGFQGRARHKTMSLDACTARNASSNGICVPRSCAESADGGPEIQTEQSIKCLAETSGQRQSRSTKSTLKKSFGRLRNPMPSSEVNLFVCYAEAAAPFRTTTLSANLQNSTSFPDVAPVSSGISANLLSMPFHPFQSFDARPEGMRPPATVPRMDCPGRLSPNRDNPQHLNRPDYHFMSPRWAPAIPLGLADLPCGKSTEDLTCRRYDADEMTTVLLHTRDLWPGELSDLRLMVGCVHL